MGTFTEKFKLLRHYASEMLNSTGLPVAAVTAIAGITLVAGWPAALLAVGGGAVLTMLGMQAPMEAASKGTQAMMYAIPLIGAAVGGAIGGAFTGFALAGAVAGVAAFAGGVGILFGLQALADIVAPEKFDASPQHKKSASVAGKVAAAALSAVIGFGAFHYKEDIRDLPVIRTLFNQKAHTLPGATIGPLVSNAPDAPKARVLAG